MLKTQRIGVALSFAAVIIAVSPAVFPHHNTTEHTIAYVSSPPINYHPMTEIYQSKMIALNNEHIAHIHHLEHVAYLQAIKLAIQPTGQPQPAVQPVSVPVTAGLYSCTMLESLWESVGGNPAYAFIAAEIATAESGGNPNAISPTDDYGLWQINASHGSMASLNPVVNAQSAVAISDDGTDWTPWTTYTSGAYIGQCL